MVWASPVDILAAAEADLDQPLLLLRAQADAVGRALDAAPAGTRAVVQAGYAAEVARLTAGADAGGTLDRRLAAIEAGQDRLLEMLGRAGRGRRGAGRGARGRCSAGSTPGTRSSRRRRRCSRRSAAGSSAWSRPPATRAAFQETLGLTLAEFLARIEARGRARRAGARAELSGRHSGERRPPP